jgi:hypothetical protein
LITTKIHKEAIAVVGKYYEDNYQVGFNKHGSLADQTENCDFPTGSGIVEIVDTARAMAAYVARVAGKATPPLPSE